MSSRLPAVAINGSSFYEQQQLQLTQQHTAMSSTPIAASSSSMHLHAAALQHRLHEYHQQRPPPPGPYDNCYYPSGSTGYMHRSHNSSPYSYAVPHYASAPNYLSHPHHPHLGQPGSYPHHHDSYGLLAHRTRYLSYQQQSPHLHHSLFTPAGQQLMPSSVLHYPPRIYPPRSLEESMRSQHPPMSSHPSPHMYDFRGEPHAQYQSRQPYMPMHHAPSGTAASYNPYAISQHHFQQSQALESLPRSMRAPEAYNEAVTNSSARNSLTHTNKISNTFSELPTTISSPADIPNHKEYICKKELDDDDNDEARIQAKEFSGTAQQRNVTESDLTTTSPPLTSGTDSGISCCSTRGAHSDSTHGTPMHCGDYQPPMSVGSSSSTVPHCADSKEFEETVCSNSTGNDDLPSDASIARETAGCETEHIPKAQMNDGNNDDENTTAQLTLAQKAKEDVNKKEFHETSNSKTDVQDLHATTRLSSQQSTSKSSSGTTTISSPTNEHRTTPFRHIPSPHDFQQQTSASQQQFRNHINSSWSPFSISPNSWTQQYNNNGRATPNNRAQQQSPPLLVPAPPHNSPVDYAPLNMSTLYQPAVVQSTNKNRIIECDLIPSKKSKRTNSIESQVVVREEIQNITPLPGFQQTFGSTEIGRFSETFLHSPPVSVSGVNEQCENFSTTHAEPRMLQRAAWPAYPFETFDFNGSSRSRSRGGRDGPSLGQFNQFGARPPYVERVDMMAYERNGYSGRMNGSLTEIRCNGY